MQHVRVSELLAAELAEEDRLSAEVDAAQGRIFKMHSVAPSKIRLHNYLILT